MSEQGRPGAEADALARSPSLADWVRDWRFWLGLAITLVSVWIAVRGIPLGEVLAAMQRANFLALLVASAPFYVASVYLRALRWRTAGAKPWSSYTSRTGSETSTPSCTPA